MTPWDRINNELDRRKMGWPWLREQLGVTKQAAGHWSERGIPKKYYRAIGMALGKSIDWVEFGEEAGGPPGRSFEPTKIIDLEDNPEYPSIRRVTFKLSAGASGFGIEYDHGDAAPIVFRRTWYESRGFHPAKLFAVNVANGSMEPGLFNGDTVVVNTESTAPKDGVVFAVNYEGEMLVKRLVRDAGQWWLLSDNADQRRYPRKLCDENVRIIGEVVHKQSERI